MQDETDPVITERRASHCAAGEPPPPDPGDIEYRPRIPPALKAPARRGYDLLAAATAPWRLLPDYLVIGGQRCGTTSLQAYLTQHPLLPRSLRKEIHYFDLHYAEGVAWYRRHFASRPYARLLALRYARRPLVGEATPDYLFFPGMAERAAALVPHARLIAIVRDPIDRAFSHYQKELARGFETLSFADAVESEPERLDGEFERLLDGPTYYSHAYDHFSYLARGVYADQLARWLEHYPREQLLVLRSEDMFSDAASVHRRALEFLGLPVRLLPSYPRRNVRAYKSLDADLRRRLQAYFRPHNERLSQLVGSAFDWGEPPEPKGDPSSS